MHLFEDCLRDADPTSVSDLLQPRRDVHGVAANAIILNNHGSGMYADPVLNLLLPRPAPVTPAGSGLDRQRRLQRCLGTCKFGHQSIAGDVHYATAKLLDLPYDGSQISFHSSVRPNFIARNHEAVVLDIERKKCRKPPLDPAAA